MSSDAAAKLWDDNINRRLFELTHSQSTSEAFGGLSAIGEYASPIPEGFQFIVSQKNCWKSTKKKL
jgi:FKBP12-rapamycin complex-associated protein